MYYNGIKGGSISGEDRKPYEKVYYKEDSEKPIIMTPDPAYEIVRIRINDEDIEFTPEEDGTYQLPQFENVTEDKHVIVTYAKKTNKLVINKIDSETGENITGATFKLDQIEEREEILKEEVFGEKIDNGDIIPNVDKSSGEIENVLGDFINPETYYFVERDGKYVPTNSKTYQEENGGTVGIKNSTANSYVEIDLPCAKGTKVGRMDVWCNDEKIGEIPLVTDRALNRPTFFENIKLTKEQESIASLLIKEIQNI